MSARSENFPWPSHYGHFKYFESVMIKHHCVADLTEIDEGVYDLVLTSGKSLRVFICECYSYGVAECMQTIESLDQLDAIIINSVWCGYTPDAKRFWRGQQVGLFNIGDFMSAINKPKHWLYLNEKEAKDFKERGWL